MFEHAVYDSEHDKWYNQGDDPWVVRPMRVGEKFKPILFVVADTYMDAAELLFLHSPLKVVTE